MVRNHSNFSALRMGNFCNVIFLSRIGAKFLRLKQFCTRPFKFVRSIEFELIPRFFIPHLLEKKALS